MKPNQLFRAIPTAERLPEKAGDYYVYCSVPEIDFITAMEFFPGKPNMEEDWEDVKYWLEPLPDVKDCETCKYLEDDNAWNCTKCDEGFCMWESIETNKPN